MKHAPHSTSAARGRQRRHSLLGAGLASAALLCGTLPAGAHATTLAASLAAASDAAAPGQAAAGFVPTTLTLHSGRNNQQLGTHLNTGACDFDGDGSGDVTATGALALGGEDFVDMAAQRRRDGHADSLTDLPQWTGWTTDGTTGFTCAGDVNGDGHDDLVEVPAANARVVSVEHSAGTRNSSGRLEQNRVRRYTFPNGTSRLGEKVLAPAGDLDGDGAGEVMLSQHTATTSAGATGRLWVLAGVSAPTVPGSLEAVAVSGPDAPSDRVALVVDGPAGDRLGAAVALGDVTGDGLDDLAVAAESGTVWLLHGQARGEGTARHVDLGDLSAADGRVWATGATGVSSLAVGDVTGDDLPDLVLGLGADLTSDGGVAVLSGSADTTPVTVDVAAGTVRDASQPRGYLVRAERAGDALGHSVAVPGDLDGDGRDDLLVGAPGHDPVDPATGQRSTDTGAAYVLAGRAGGEALALSTLTSAQGHRIDGTRGAAQAADRPSRFGTRVAAVGDVDGNAHVDLAISAPGRSEHATYRQGAVVVALRGEVDALLQTSIARRHGDDGIAVRDGAVLKASDVLDVRANLRLRTQQGVAGAVEFTVDGVERARATSAVSAPHRAFAFAEGLQVSEVGEHVIGARSRAVPGSRGRAEAPEVTVLVTDSTRTVLAGKGRELVVSVVSAVAGTPVADGTVDVTAADGTVVARDVALTQGRATLVLPDGTPRTGTTVTYSGRRTTFAGEDVQLLGPSSATAAAPSAPRAALTLKGASYGTSVAATLSFDRTVSTTAHVHVDGTRVQSVEVAGSSARFTLPRTLAVGTHDVRVTTVADEDAASATASGRVQVSKVSTGKLRASAAKFRAGTRPVVKIVVPRSSDGSWPVGRVTVKVAGKKHTATLTAARKGKVSIKVAKRRSATKATVSFAPRSPATHTAPKKVVVKVRPKG